MVQNKFTKTNLVCFADVVPAKDDILKGVSLTEEVVKLAGAGKAWLVL